MNQSNNRTLCFSQLVKHRRCILRLKQQEIAVRLSPELRLTVKTLLAVRCHFIVPHPGTVLG